ncbi:MAG: TfoX/Sxy family protein [Candidatus Altimarinota bacterium]
MNKKQLPEILKYFLEDLLFDEIGYRAKSMFSGWGIYRFGKMFAILIEDEFYFKTGANNIQDYLENFSKPFTYTVKGQIRQMSYYRLPEEILENSDELKVWIQKSLDVPEKIKTKKTSPNISKID